MSFRPIAATKRSFRRFAGLALLASPLLMAVASKARQELARETGIRRGAHYRPPGFINHYATLVFGGRQTIITVQSGRIFSRPGLDGHLNRPTIPTATWKLASDP